MLGQILAVQDEVGRAMDPVRAKFAEAIRKQQGVVDLWRFASPAISIHEALADLAGTGYWRHRAFQEQVESFKQDLHGFYSPKIHKRQSLTKADIPNLPSFEFVEEAPASLSGRVVTGVAGILALALLAAIVAGLRLSARKLAA
jgi:ABC-2 type transport system permease protein